MSKGDKHMSQMPGVGQGTRASTTKGGGRPPRRPKKGTEPQRWARGRGDPMTKTKCKGI